MKFTKKCDNTQTKISIKEKLDELSNRRRSSAGMFYTSSAGAVTSLILMLVFCGAVGLLSLTGATNLLGLGGSAYADYTLSMTSSGAQSIDVAPSSSGIGTSIGEDAITVSTTCRSGYNLSMSTSVNDNKLYLDGNSSSSSFFSPVDGTSPLANSTNKWGYYFNDSSTAPTPSNVFSAIPALGSTAVIKSPLPTPSSTDIEDSFSIYYGVGVNSSLTPGTYKMKPDTNNSNADGTIVYYLTMAESCLKTYMQDVTEADLAELMPDDGDSVTLYDKRDENDYQITKINGNYWMTNNLRFTGTSLNSTTSNVDSNYTESSPLEINYGDLTSGNTYSEARIHSGKDGDDNKGNSTVWYNYAAASAMTITSSSDTNVAQYDICPKGWQLPTSGQASDVVSYRALFNPVTGGRYYNRSLGNNTTGSYWTSTSSSNVNRYRIYWDKTNLTTNGVTRYNGNYIRCVKKADPTTLYELVATAWVKEGSRVMTNDTNANTGIQAAISTSNSGVFKYNPTTFGTSSDAANTHDIYFYRGILDTTVGSYGSDGDNAAHPNTVILDANNNGKDKTDTCWRIVRTTGSGGVKMIYQGKWTGSTCANSGDNAQVTTKAFNGTGFTNNQIVRVGYTYNSTYAESTSKSGTIAQIFGSNSNPGANNTRSTIKEYIEDTWYANNMTSYTSKLEASAGYCNDRTMNTTDSWTTPLAESTTIASTYGTSDQQAYYFGAYPRNANAAQSPSLTCGNKYSQIDRSTVDLYRYVSGSTGVSNQLKYPAALLTTDEAAFAGSGYSSSTTPYHVNSFLHSGSLFWLLSPYRRASNGAAHGFSLFSYGALHSDFVSSELGVRPAISLKPGSMAVSGSGTATDPWIVNP